MALKVVLTKIKGGHSNLTCLNTFRRKLKQLATLL